MLQENSQSRQIKLPNGLLQGSVLAPLLFNLYIAGMLTTTSIKFGYANAWTLAIQHKRMNATEDVLTRDLTALGNYFRKWRLQTSVTKTETSYFHLNNRLAHQELRVRFNNSVLPYNKNSKYVRVTLDRTLSYNKHLTNTAAKIRTRNNIIQKLCGFWDSPRIF